jgi:phospholipid transport system substrate-binding protein
MKYIKLLSFLLIFFCHNSFAQVSENDIKKFVNKLGNDIIKVASNSKISEQERVDQTINIIDKSIDSKWIARFVLSKNYRIANQKQRDRFSSLYRQFMINTYGPKFKNYNGKKFEVTKVATRGRYFIAKAEFLPKDSNTPILIDFRLKAKDNKIYVLDFVTEGISLIETQRSEFNSAISTDGFEKFLENLNTRVKKLKKENHNFTS